MIDFLGGIVVGIGIGVTAAIVVAYYVVGDADAARDEDRDVVADASAPYSERVIALASRLHRGSLVWSDAVLKAEELVDRDDMNRDEQIKRDSRKPTTLTTDKANVVPLDDYR